MFARSVVSAQARSRIRVHQGPRDRRHPVLRKQKGFQDEITFVADGGKEAVGISLWDLKENAETYARGSYPGVLKAMEHVIDGLRLRFGPTTSPTRPSTRSPLA